MKRLLILVIIAAAGYFGLRYYQAKKLSIVPANSYSDYLGNVEIPQVSSGSQDYLKVLGASTQNIFAKGTALLNSATGGKAEPVINKAVKDLQDRVKELPAEEYKRVKYEFCKDVFPSSSPSPEPGL